LREADGWEESYDAFVTWSRRVTMTLPSMDFYVYNISAPAIRRAACVEICYFIFYFIFKEIITTKFLEKINRQILFLHE
jgi:hypothetical protein